LIRSKASALPRIKEHQATAPDTTASWAVDKAVQHNVAIAGLGDFRLARRSGRGAGIVISFGTPPNHDYSTTVARLCAALTELRQ
jgi:DNA-binding transcriptional MocR family regulator